VALSECPSCGSDFLQPLRCEAQGEEDVLVDMRCPECMTHLQAPYSRADMAELDRRQSEWRDEIVAAYERSVAESMEALAACLVPALAQDLIGADDFAPRRLARAV
jgi:threonine synthase